MRFGPAEIAILSQWLAAAGAIAAAFLIGYVAHNTFGVSWPEIRVTATIGASALVALLVVEYFGRKLRNTK